MVSGYTLTAFPNAFILQQPQLKQQPTNQARSMFKRGIRTVHPQHCPKQKTIAFRYFEHLICRDFCTKIIETPKM